MNIKVDLELKDICEEILKENKTMSEWALIESSDMFQSKHFIGGYDATEEAFCFSYYDDQGKEFWFQFTLDQAKEIIDNKLQYLNPFQPS